MTFPGRPPAPAAGRRSAVGQQRRRTTCSWNTNADSLDSQRWYVRATATVGSVTYESIRSTVVDNEDPDVALTVPAAPLYGTVPLTATADDTDSNVGDESSGIASVLFEYRRAGPANWVSCGTDNSTPYACSLDTTALTTGNYEFRATATDGAGNTTTTTMQPRQVDNSPKVTITAPSGPGTYPAGLDGHACPPTPGRQRRRQLGAAPVRPARRRRRGRTSARRQQRAVRVQLEHRRRRRAGPTDVRAVMTPTTGAVGQLGSGRGHARAAARRPGRRDQQRHLGPSRRPATRSS